MRPRQQNSVSLDSLHAMSSSFVLWPYTHFGAVTHTWLTNTDPHPPAICRRVRAQLTSATRISAAEARMAMLPAVGLASPAMALSSVVLPAPLRPNTRPRLLAGSSRLTSSRIGASAPAASELMPSHTRLHARFTAVRGNLNV